MRPLSPWSRQAPAPSPASHAIPASAPAHPRSVSPKPTSIGSPPPTDLHALVVRVLLQQGTPVAPNLRWRCAALVGLPLHQLDGRRGAHGKAAGRLPDRAATLDNSH